MLVVMCVDYRERVQTQRQRKRKMLVKVFHIEGKKS